MTLNDLTRLLTYNEWANARVFGDVATLTHDQLTQDLKSSFPSVLATVAHLVGAEWVWLERWLGTPQPKFPAWVAKPDLAEVRAQLADIERRRAALFAGLSDAEVLVPRHYKLQSGVEDAQPLDVMVTHLVNHSTYHRGQVATFFRQLGLKATSTDFITFARQ